MPSDAVLKTMNTLHRVMLKASGGLIGWTGLGMPVIELTTVGRKSGRPRSVMLTAPIHDGDTYVIVASRGGDDTHPAWFLNLRDNPEVEVTRRGRRAKMRARIVGPDERPALWERVTSDHKNYADYQKRTEREIPLVVLEPA